MRRGGEGVAWPEYRAERSRGLLIGDSTAVGNVGYTVCGFWDGIAAGRNGMGVRVRTVLAS